MAESLWSLNSAVTQYEPLGLLHYFLNLSLIAKAVIVSSFSTTRLLLNFSERVYVPILFVI